MIFLPTASRNIYQLPGKSKRCPFGGWFGVIDEYCSELFKPFFLVQVRPFLNKRRLF